MRKILLTTTALIALGSVSAVAADISLSGNLRWRYQTWSDDNPIVAGQNNNSMGEILQLWVRSSETLDNGMTIGTNTRLRAGGNIDRNWIDINGDFGSFDLGRQFSPSYTASLHEGNVATVAGGDFTGGSVNGAAVAARNGVLAAQASDGVAVAARPAAVATGFAAMNKGYIGGINRNNKIIYSIPAVAGLNASIGYADAGGTSEANETSLAVTYDLAIADGNIKLVYANVKFDGATATSATNEGREIGVEYSSGFGRIYATQQNVTTTPGAGGAKTNDQEGITFGGMYNLNDATKVVYSRHETDQDGTTDTGDKYSSDTIGVRYDIAGGLRFGLLHTNYDFTDAGNAASNDNGSATRFEVRVDF